MLYTFFHNLKINNKSCKLGVTTPAWFAHNLPDFNPQSPTSWKPSQSQANRGGWSAFLQQVWLRWPLRTRPGQSETPSVGCRL